MGRVPRFKYSLMPARPPPDLNPRKKPRQTRAAATLDAIFEATLQVLVAVGPGRLTTTRVAERAGVSVGSMYQYFPNKQALFYALNENYLDALAGKIEATCVRLRGTPIREMVEGIVTTYWDVKMANPEVTRVLYRSVAELDNEPMLEAFRHRVDAATTALFASASDATFADLPGVNLTLLATIFGTIRSVFERHLSDTDAALVRTQLVAMCNAYLDTIKQPAPRKRR